MENKKQLVIVPPMSEPLQKLNEVLKGISNEENIEISIIENPDELAQFLGSTGQCLVAFSNAKLCATTLQENRFLLTMNHSKVILLTPKEIPAKTLAKFIKLGLTESILESSPPKTLLYKVRLLLRSIKTSVTQQENNDQIVKSMLDLNASLSSKNDFSSEKGHKTYEILEAGTDEKLKKLIDNDDKNSNDLVENKKNKHAYQQEAIDTTWKAKEKPETSQVLFDEPSPEEEKDKNDGLSNIDIYYRGKKKDNSTIDFEHSASLTKKNIGDSEYSDAPIDESYKKKNATELSLDLNVGASDDTKSNYTEVQDGTLSIKRSEETFNLDEMDKQLKKENLITEEEKALARKKELEEFDALFEAAKKKQAELEEVADEGYQGKIINNSLKLEKGDDEVKEIKEYDNSDLDYNKKKNDHNLTPASLERKKSIDQEHDDYEKAPPKTKTDGGLLIETNPTNKKSDSILLEEGELDADKSKNNKTQNIFDLAQNKKEKEELKSEEFDYSENKKNKLLIEDADLDNKKQEEEKEIYERLEDSERKKETTLNLEDAMVERTKEALESNENTKDSSRDKSTLLQLDDGDTGRSKSMIENEETNMSFKKINQHDIELDAGKNHHRHDGKVDKIDTFYRSEDAKKTEYNWDNLTDKKNAVDLDFGKSSRRENEINVELHRKDAGEITIDYRKLKKEFDYFSRNGKSDEGDIAPQMRSEEIRNSEDSGSFEVVEIDARSFDFGIEIVNLIYQKDSKPVDFYKKISEELISHYSAYPIFYTFKSNDKKYVESFDSFMHFGNSLVSIELKEWWMEAKRDQDTLNHYFEKTMTTWLCREIPGKSGGFWEDAELPSWAANELTNKKVEMVFPYFDGVDRMGMAVLIFPDGVNSAKEKSIITTLEMARTIFLDSIQRTISTTEKLTNEDAPAKEKKNITSMFAGLFNRNKAG